MSKIAVITGGSSGFGLADAKEFKKSDYTVIIAARNREKLLAAQKECGADDIFTMDVTNYDDWTALKDYVIEKYSKIDVMVNNAGAGVSIKDVDTMTKAEIDATVSLNLTSVIYSGNIIGAIMKKQRSGIIINVASVCAKHCWGKWSVYAAAKAGVLNFSKGLYVELQPYDVRVTCIIPASCGTGFQKSACLDQTNDSLSAEDIAKSVLYAAELPPRAVVEEMTVWGTSQAVQPL